MAVDLTTLPNIDTTTEPLLHDLGYDDYEDIVASSPEQLKQHAGLSLPEASEVIEAAIDQMESSGFMTGSNIQIHDRNADSLTTTHPELDEYLGGGITAGEVTEVYGNTGSGRTTFTHLLTVAAQLPTEYGGLDGSVLYFDTRMKFRPDRIETILDGLSDKAIDALHDKYRTSNQDTLLDAVLNNIHIITPTTVDEQLAAGEDAARKANDLNETTNPPKLIIEDSASIWFRTEYGMESLSERQQDINTHLRDLDRISDISDAAVVITNTTASGNDPYGGKILDHHVDKRLQIRMTSGEKRHLILDRQTEDWVGAYIRDGRFVPDSG